MLDIFNMTKMLTFLRDCLVFTIFLLIDSSVLNMYRNFCIRLYKGLNGYVLASEIFSLISALSSL